MTSSVRAKRAADQKAANRREEEMRLAKLEGRILEAEEIVKQEAPEEPVAEKPAPNQRDHLMDCLRYYINCEPEYVVPDKEKAEPSIVWKEFQEWKKPKPSGPDDIDNPMKIGPGLAR